MVRVRIWTVVAVVAWGVALLAGAPAAPPETTAGLAQVKLAEKPVEVLSGRLTVRVPQGAQAEPRSHSIMGAPESDQHETRITLDAGQERLVLMAAETFALAGDDFEKEVRECLAKEKGKYKVEPLQLPGKGLKAVAVTPVADPDHARNEDATFVAGLFVESADRTIQSLDVYVNAAAEKDLEGCRALARQILLSVAPGDKKLQLAAGQRRLFAFSKDVEIVVSVDKNTVATTQVGPDFLVHRLIVLGRLGADQSSIGVYVGDHPSFTPGEKKGSGTMFGKKIDWHAAREGRGLETLCELSIPGENGLKAHVWIRAANDAQLAALKKAAETLKLSNAKQGSKDSTPSPLRPLRRLRRAGRDSAAGSQ